MPSLGISYMYHMTLKNLYNTKPKYRGGVRGVMVIVVGNGHGDTSSNPGRD